MEAARNTPLSRRPNLLDTGLTHGTFLRRCPSHRQWRSLRAHEVEHRGGFLVRFEQGRMRTPTDAEGRSARPSSSARAIKASWSGKNPSSPTKSLTTG